MPEPSGEPLLELVRVMDRLRSPAGCPWDARQTHRSLVEYLIEESYETVEAIDEGDRDGLREELGDLLLHVCLQAQIGQERGQFTFDEVAHRLADKLIRRHPHVFSGQIFESPEDRQAYWEAELSKEAQQRKATAAATKTLNPTEIEELARQHNLKYFEVSAKANLNINEVFEELMH